MPRLTITGCASSTGFVASAPNLHLHELSGPNLAPRSVTSGALAINDASRALNCFCPLRRTLAGPQAQVLGRPQAGAASALRRVLYRGGRVQPSTQRQPTNVESVISGAGNFTAEVSSSTTTGSTSSSARLSRRSACGTRPRMLREARVRQALTACRRPRAHS